MRYEENKDVPAESCICQVNWMFAACPRHGHLVPEGKEKTRGGTPERMRELVKRRQMREGKRKDGRGRPKIHFTKEEVKQLAIDQLMPRALEVLQEQLYSKDERVAANAAVKVLEYVKGKPTQTVKTEGEQVHTIKYESAAWQPGEVVEGELVAEDDGDPLQLPPAA